MISYCKIMREKKNLSFNREPAKEKEDMHRGNKMTTECYSFQ